MCVCVGTCVHVCVEMQVLMRLVLNPYIYMDKVAVMMQEAVCLQTKIQGQEKNPSSAPILHIDGELLYNFT